MAKALSKVAQESRDAAAKHRVLASLYDRRAAQQELSDNLESYGTQLEDVKASIERLDRQIAELASAQLQAITPAGRA